MYLDIGICLFLLLSMFLGWRKGLMRGVIGLVSSIVALVAAIFMAKPFSKMFDNWFGLSESIGGLIKTNGKFLSVLICGIIVYLIVTLFFLLLSRFILRIKRESKAIDKVDKVLGIFLGMAKCLVAVCIFFLVIYLVSGISFIETALESLFDKSAIGKFIYKQVVNLVVPFLGDLDASALTNLF